MYFFFERKLLEMFLVPFYDGSLDYIYSTNLILLNLTIVCRSLALDKNWLYYFKVNVHSKQVSICSKRPQNIFFTTLSYPPTFTRILKHYREAQEQIIIISMHINNLMPHYYRHKTPFFFVSKYVQEKC